MIMKVAGDYLKDKEAGTLKLTGFDDLLNECGIDKASL